VIAGWDADQLGGLMVVRKLACNLLGFLSIYILVSVLWHDDQLRVCDPFHQTALCLFRSTLLKDVEERDSFLLGWVKVGHEVQNFDEGSASHVIVEKNALFFRHTVDEPLVEVLIFPLDIL
jgi:hypothetical protein